MPIFHDVGDPSPPDCRSGAPLPNDTSSFEHSEQRARNELSHQTAEFEGLNVLARPDYIPGAGNEARPMILDRGELIERIKKGVGPNWSPKQSHDTIPNENAWPQSTDRQHSPLPFHPAAGTQPSPKDESDQSRSNSCSGFDIERPKSALHSGDFRQGKDVPGYDDSPRREPFTVPQSGAWSFVPPSPDCNVSEDVHVPPIESPLSREVRPARSRAISQSSLSSSYFKKLPTSPLAYQSNSADIDFAANPRSNKGSRSPDRRRHTFSPQSLQRFQTTSFPEPNSALGTLPAPPRGHGGSALPYQAHQPRRSISHGFNFSNPQTPLLRPRRPSIASELSPLHHAPMVGSYEESILRGRMSTTPSRPLNFVAQIGVLGRGQCKATLRCPSHVTVPFPAVFYSYSSGNGRIPEDQPSPYVGLVDLENHLKPADPPSEGRRRRRHVMSSSDHEDFADQAHRGEEWSDSQSKVERRRMQKMKRRSTSPKSPPGGSYRIPQQGQLQIVIKNPNKTAVKLFLVPYDLTDMEAGQKTFIRQRSYSAGPIIDMPLSSRTNLGTDRPEASLSNSDDPRDRPMLRYLIHLHICCPSKGRYFLYKSIRVVFANRVPDGKEKLRNEIQLPEPRYSTYKPGRDLNSIHNNTATAMSSANAIMNAERALRRRSAGLPFAANRYDQLDGIGFLGNTTTATNQTGSEENYYSLPPIQPIPFNLFRLPSVESRPTSREQMDLDSPFRSRYAEHDLRRSPKSQAPMSGNASFSDSWMQSEDSSCGSYDKLSKGDVGYGGNAFSPSNNGALPGPGLLAKRLKGLDVQKQEGGHQSDAAPESPSII